MHRVCLRYGKSFLRMLIGSAAVATTSTNFPHKHCFRVEPYVSGSADKCISAQRRLRDLHLVFLVGLLPYAACPLESVGSATVLSRLPPPEISSAWFSDTGQQVSSCFESRRYPANVAETDSSHLEHQTAPRPFVCM